MVTMTCVWCYIGLLEWVILNILHIVTRVVLLGYTVSVKLQVVKQLRAQNWQKFKKNLHKLSVVLMPVTVTGP